MNDEEKAKTGDDERMERRFKISKMLAILSWINALLSICASVINWCGGKPCAVAGWLIATMAWCEVARERWFSAKVLNDCEYAHSLLRKSMDMLGGIFAGVAVVVADREHNGCPSHPGEEVPEVVLTGAEGSDGKAEQK